MVMKLVCVAVKIVESQYPKAHLFLHDSFIIIVTCFYAQYYMIIGSDVNYIESDNQLANQF